VDQRIKEVDSKADSDDQSDDGLDHWLFSLQSVAGDGVNAHQDEEGDSDCEIDGVSHGANLRLEPLSCSWTPQAINMARRRSL
jgi:hypothetical protein